MSEDDFSICRIVATGLSFTDRSRDDYGHTRDSGRSPCGQERVRWLLGCGKGARCGKSHDLLLVFHRAAAWFPRALAEAYPIMQPGQR